jgi:glycosyltransferase involved in cell wall biosynthesis
VRQFTARYAIAAQHLASPPLSKSRALNTGIRAAETEWLAFTDDDTLADPGWLRQAQGFMAAGVCRVFGGRVAPGPVTGAPPIWARRLTGHETAHLGVAFVRYEPMARNGVLNGAQPVPLGANFFVRRDVFAERGLYDEALWDRCGPYALGVEDAEMGLRLRHAGEPTGYCHDAVVRHPVASERLRLSFLISKAYAYGWREPVLFPGTRRSFGGYGLRRGIVLSGQALFGMMCFNPAGWVGALLDLAALAGEAAGRRARR